MLKKRFRLKKIDFEEIFKLGRKYKNNFFTIIKLSNQKEKKFAVLSNKKEFKKAVVRNKIKRRIYEIIRLNFNKIPRGTFLIFPKKSSLNLNFKELKERLTKILINKISTYF